jgi:hypothetical protein
MSTSLPLASLSPGFVVVFAVFALAVVVLSFLTLRWAIRRDRIGRQEWLRRRQAEMAAPLDAERDLQGPGLRRRRAQRGADSNGHGPGSDP